MVSCPCRNTRAQANFVLQTVRPALWNGHAARGDRRLSLLYRLDLADGKWREIPSNVLQI